MGTTVEDIVLCFDVVQGHRLEWPTFGTAHRFPKRFGFSVSLSLCVHASMGLVCLHPVCVCIFLLYFLPSFCFIFVQSDVFRFGKEVLGGNFTFVWLCEILKKKLARTSVTQVCYAWRYVTVRTCNWLVSLRVPKNPQLREKHVCSALAVCFSTLDQCTMLRLCSARWSVTHFTPDNRCCLT